MLKTQKLTREFMKACKLQMSDTPTATLAFKKLGSLVEEEYEEFIAALKALECYMASDHSDMSAKRIAKLMVDVIDAMCDLIVVIHNTSNAMGIDLEPFFDEVHKKNMEKVGGPKREDGKQLKPDDWTPPDHESILKMIQGVPIEEQYKYQP
jgi:predicted HAD superfamily Cof-like phosphohydrolase